MILYVLAGILILVPAFIFLVLFSSADRSVLLQRSRSFEFGGMTRKYREYQKGPIGDQPTIIIALHPLGGTGRQMAYYSTLHNELNDNSILIYPDAIMPQHEGERRGWNADFCCGSGWKNNVDDLGFISALIDSLVAKYNPKDSKVFIAGFSNGAIFAHKIASEIPDKIAGFAAIAGSIGTKSAEHIPTKPVPALLIHGKQDKTIYIDGGATPDEPDFGWLSFTKTTESWQKANKCSEPTTSEDDNQRVTNYAKCSAQLTVVVNKHDRHQWPNWRLFNIWHRHSSGSKQVIDFFNSL